MSANEHCALARANRVFRADEKRIRTENTVMQLLRNNCHIRANVFVVLVAASGRAKDKNKDIAGLGKYTRSSIARGRFFARATSQFGNRARF